jgi:hypothetical protein
MAQVPVDLQKLVDHFFVADFNRDFAQIFVGFQLLPLFAAALVMEVKQKLSVFDFIFIRLTTYALLIA